MSDLQAHEPRLSKFQGYVIKRIARGQISNASYNPRTMDKGAKKALRDELRTNMLVEPLIWNERTGNLVGGHQRLEQLDALEGSPDYSLDLAVINVDEKKERAINVALNNPAIQGSYDFGKLEQLLGEDGFDFAAAGLDQMTMATWFGEDAPIANNPFALDQAPDAVRQTVGELDELQGQPREPKKKRAEGEAPSQADETPDERIERMKREKKEYREAAADRDDTEYMAIVVFPDRAHREKFMDLLGLDKAERYVKGAHLAEQMGVSELLFPEE